MNFQCTTCYEFFEEDTENGMCPICYENTVIPVDYLDQTNYEQ